MNSLSAVGLKDAIKFAIDSLNKLVYFCVVIQASYDKVLDTDEPFEVQN